MRRQTETAIATLIVILLALAIAVALSACAEHPASPTPPGDSATADTACVTYTTSRDRLKIGRLCK